MPPRWASMRWCCNRRSISEDQIEQSIDEPHDQDGLEADCWHRVALVVADRDIGHLIEQKNRHHAPLRGVQRAPKGAVSQENERDEWQRMEPGIQLRHPRMGPLVANFK